MSNLDDENRETTPAPALAETARAPVLRRFVLWTMLGVGSGIVATVAILAVISRDPTPPLTPAIFDAARQRWNTAAPASYDIEVRVSGPQPATYRAQVRDGQARAAWRNGAPLTSQRTFGTWSVPGMFNTIGRDVDAIQEAAAGRARPGAPDLILKAEFDAKYSYPRRYRRIEWGSQKGSTAVTVSWEVTEFSVR